MATNDEIEDLLTRLAGIPERISRSVKGWDEAELHTRPATSEWSASEILAHIRASDDILAYRAYAILARNNPPLVAYDERRWAEVARYAQSNFQISLSAFTLKRADLVQMLRAIAPADWKRTGIHEVHGPQSLLHGMNTLLEHEEVHCTQLEAIYHK